MKYTTEIALYALLPLTIVISYYAIRLMLRLMDKPTKVEDNSIKM